MRIKNGITCGSLLLLLMLPIVTPVWAVYPVFPATVTIWGENGAEYTQTAADGTFRLNMTQGNYSAIIMANGFIDYTFTLTVSGGNTTNVGDILLTPSAKVSGRLLGPNGEPISSGTLYLCRQSNDSVVSMTMSSSNGSFIFDRNVRTGTYYIRTETTTPGCVDVKVYNISATAGQTTSDIIVRLDRSGTIAGTVKSITNAPIGNANVFIFAPSNASIFQLATTNEQGFYNQSWGLPPNTYNVSLFASKIDGYITSVPDIQVVVQAGQTSTADFVLRRSANISGTVRYSNGVPAEGVGVFATSTNGLYFATGYTDENGRYALDTNLDIANYTVIAQYDYFNAKDVSITAEGQSVTGVDFVLSESPPVKAWIKGTITSGGQPISATVSANDTFFDWTPTNGSYTIEVELPEGQTTATYNVTASKMGYFKGFRFPVTVSANQTVTGIDISLVKMPTGIVIGRVVSNVPPPKQNASLTLTASTSNATVGTSVTLSGSTSPSQSGEVSIYYSLNGSAYALLTNKTLTGGTYSHSFNLSQVGTYTFYATWPGNDAYNPATSTTVTVISSPQPVQKTTPTVTISSSKTSVTLDANHTSEVITITGTISPFLASTTVNIRVTDPNNQVTTIPISAAASTFSANVTINKGGTWSIQARVPEGATYNAASSNTISVSAQVVQVGGGDNTALIVVGVIVAVAIGVVLFLFMRKKK